MRIWNRILAVLIGAWLPILLIYLWWTASADSTNPFFPPLSDIWPVLLALAGIGVSSKDAVK